MTTGYGRADSADGMVFAGTPALGTYWTAADMLMVNTSDKEGGRARCWQEDHLVYARPPLWQGADPVEAGRPTARLRSLLPVVLTV